MSIFTGRELEFVTSLSTSWKLLYWNELVRLLKENDGSYDARHEPGVGREREYFSETGWTPNRRALSGKSAEWVGFKNYARDSFTSDTSASQPSRAKS